MTEPGEPQQRPSHSNAFAQHLIRMPRWHKTLLTLAVALMIVGGAVQIVTAIHSRRSCSMCMASTGRLTCNVQ